MAHPACGAGDAPKLRAFAAFFLLSLVLSIGAAALARRPADTSLLLEDSMTPASLQLEGRGETVGVWISGRVERPGRHELARGSTLVDLLALSRVRPDAYIDANSLPYELSDMDKVYIPPKLDLSSNRVTITEENLQVVKIERFRPPVAKAAGGGLDINLATVEQLQELPGVGPVLAKRIIDHRNQYGPFRSVKDLMQVKGIGPKKFESIREHLVVR